MVLNSNISNGSFTESQGTRYKMSYLYDDGDHITQMTLPSGRVVDYSRDGLRRIKAIDTTFNGSAQNIISNIQYRGDNQVLSYAYANGLSATRSYDLQGRLQSQQLQDASNTVIDQRSYSYDKNSNLTNIDTNIEDNAYLYDKRDRLTRDTIDSNSPFDFTYDQNDNRLTKQRQDLSLNEFFEQQEKSNRLSVVAAVKPGLTPIEDLPNRDMVYNDVGRLYQLIEAGTLKAEYLYNDSGQRTRKTVYQGDGISIDSITIYHYDQQGYLITETTETGALIKDYIWQQGLHPVAQIDASMPAQAGMPSEGIIYLHTDHLLTNRLATDATRKVIWRWEGEAFGNTPASGSVSVNLRFPGQYYDAETNLHYNHFRYYDPELGRYITSDPIGLRGGMNTYGYVEQNPIVSIDPYGLTEVLYKDRGGFTSLSIIDSGGHTVTFPAANNSQKSSEGPFPQNIFPFSWWNPHRGLGPDSSYGSNGNFIFDVPNRDGMGVHSGRAGECDDVGKCGVEHATRGCIRTTDIATELLKQLHNGGDHITKIKVENDR